MAAKRSKGGGAAKKSARKPAKQVAKQSAKSAAKKGAKKVAKKGAGKVAKNVAPKRAAAPVVTGTPEPREHRITRDQAAALHKRHVGTRRARGAPAVGTVGGLFSKAAVVELLQQEGAKYLRFYYVQHEDGTPGLVLAASDEQMAIVGGADATLLNHNWQCPPFCPPDGGGLT